MKVDLTIDFDFFIREDPDWDFGHAESMFFLTTLWNLRYADHDLQKGSDIGTFADFKPIQIMEKLREKGFRFSKNTKFSIGESHAGIIKAFDGKNHAEMLINIDAHHDFFGEIENKCLPNGNSKVQAGIIIDKYIINAGNWLNYFHDKKFYKNVLIIYPKWKEIGNDGNTKNLPYKILKWDDLPKDDYEIQGIYICRSGCWVAPHHDEDFKMFATLLSLNCNKGRGYTLIGEIDPMIEREIDWDLIKEHKEHLEKFREDIKKRYEKQ
jgi:hypothetical protein